MFVALRYGLDEFLLGHERFRAVRPAARFLRFGRDFTTPRAVRLRLALEALGPIFVKFGQMLSTRRDLMPPDIADELARLQDRVPPFPSEQVVAILERNYGRPVDDVFRDFERTPVASASVAQVHFAELPNGTPVAIKVLRPGIEHVIGKDLSLLHDRGSDGREAVVGRQAAAPARGRRRVRTLAARRARPVARGRELLAASLQLPQLAAAARARRLLGLLHDRGDGDGAHVGHPDRPDRAPARGRHRHQAPRPRRRRALLHPGVPRRVLPRRHAPGQHLRGGGRGQFRQVRGASTSASSGRSPRATRAISRRTSSPSSAATTTASPRRTWNPDGCRPTRASTSSRPRSGWCASRSSTSRSSTSRSASS